MSVRSIVLDILSAHASEFAGALESIDDLPLGADGLGLDSIAIAEVLLEAEARFQRSFTHMLDGDAITVRRLTAAAEAT
jgi:acyl carrier protein